MERLRRYYESNPVRFLVIAAFAAIIVLSIILSLLTRQRGGTGVEHVAPDSAAFLIYKDETFQPTTNIESNRLLLVDLAYFARQSYPVYDPAVNPAVSFYVDKIVEQKDSTASFSGHFERAKNKITVTIAVQKNDRIKATILDTKTKTNLDSKLPSASKQNQFIATLPVIRNNYGFYYYDDTKKITIELFTPLTAAYKTTAVDDLRQQIGKQTLVASDYDLYFQAGSDVSQSGGLAKDATVAQNPNNNPPDAEDQKD